MVLSSSSAGISALPTEFVFFRSRASKKAAEKSHTQCFAFGSVEGEEVNKNFQAGGDPLTSTIPLIHLGDILVPFQVALIL